MKRLISYTLSAGLLCTSSSWAATYTVGVENNQYLPYYSYENGEYQGYAAKLLKKFASDEDIVLKFQARPISRLYLEFLRGKFDFKFPDNPAWAKDLKAKHLQGKTIAYSTGIAPFIDGTMVLSQDRNKYKSASSVKRLGIIRGFSPWDWKPQLDSGATKLDKSKNFSLLLTKIISGKVNAVYVNVDVIKYTLKRDLKQPGKLVYNPDLPYSKGEYSLSSVKHSEVIKRFNAWLEKNQDYVKSLQKQYGIGQN